MKNSKLLNVFLMLLAALMVIGTASASATASVEFTDGECSLDIWTYGNTNTVTSGYESYFDTVVIASSTWTDPDGRLAVLNDGDNMFIATKYPTECLCIVFASDRNDGYATVYVDGAEVWEGDTWADVDLAQDINAQTIRSLKITDLEFGIHTIIIENADVDEHDGHVTIYKYGYNCSNTEIPEFPTIALPIAAIIGLAFVFQRRNE